MGRSRSSVAFKKKDPSFKPLLFWPPADCPVVWEKEFGRQAPLVVEIGFGRGEFLARQAQAHPERNFIGLELTWGTVHAALHEITDRKLSNVLVLKCASQVALDWLFSPESIQEIQSLFPVPWPTQRKAKHRLFRNSFLRLANNRLKRSGVLSIITDQKPYADWIFEQAEETGFEIHLREVGPEFNTHYERKWTAKGQCHFYQIRLVKQSHLDWINKERDTMKSIRLASWNPAEFHPQDTQQMPRIEFKELIVDAPQQRAMQRVVVVENDLVQDLWIDFSKEGSGWVMRPARGCSVLPTKGVNLAVDLAAEAAQRSVTPGQNKPVLVPSSI